MSLAGEAIEEGRFAGAVRADQADDLALVDREIGAGDGARSRRTLLTTLLRVKQHGALSQRRATTRCHSSNSPPGSKRAISTMMPP